MSKATYHSSCPPRSRLLQRVSKEDGVSLNQWIATAVAQKIGVVETAATFFQGGGANGVEIRFGSSPIRLIYWLKPRGQRIEEAIGSGRLRQP